MSPLQKQGAGLMKNWRLTSRWSWRLLMRRSTGSLASRSQLTTFLMRHYVTGRGRFTQSRIVNSVCVPSLSSLRRS